MTSLHRFPSWSSTIDTTMEPWPMTTNWWFHTIFSPTKLAISNCTECVKRTRSNRKKHRLQTKTGWRKMFPWNTSILKQHLWDSNSRSAISFLINLVGIKWCRTSVLTLVSMLLPMDQTTTNMDRTLQVEPIFSSQQGIRNSSTNTLREVSSYLTIRIVMPRTYINGPLTSTTRTWQSQEFSGSRSIPTSRT